MHCSSQVKKKEKILFYYNSLSSPIKYTFPIFSLSLSGFSLSSSSIFFPLFLAGQLPHLPHPSARRPTPSSPICSADPARRPTPSPIAHIDSDDDSDKEAPEAANTETPMKTTPPFAPSPQLTLMPPTRVEAPVRLSSKLEDQDGEFELLRHG